MSRYNHFADKKYETIQFSDVPVGEKFRKDLFAGKRRRRDLIMIKTSELSYKELKSGQEHKLHHPNFTVSSYDQLIPTP
jgi:hypothetical protein